MKRLFSWKIHPELREMYQIGSCLFENSKIGTLVDGKTKHIHAPRLYEMVKEKGIKKTKFHFNSFAPNQNDRNDVDIIEVVKHCIRASECDDSIPIIVNYSGMILDGTHRIMKKILKGETRCWCYRMRMEDEDRAEAK